jgi:hypothetical protein
MRYFLEAGHAIVSSIYAFPDDSVNYNSSAPDLNSLNSMKAKNGGLSSKQQQMNAVGYAMIAFFLTICVIIILLLIYQISRRNYIRRADGQYHPTRRATKLRIERRYETVEHWIISKTALRHDAFCEKVTKNFCCQPQSESRPLQNNTETEQEPYSVTILDGNESPEESGNDHRDHTNNNNNSIAQEDIEVADHETRDCCSSFQDPDRIDEIVSSSPNCMASPIQSRGISNMETTTTTTNLPPSSQPPILHHDHPPIGAEDEDDAPECPICMGELVVGQIVSWSANPDCGHVYHHECIKEWLLRHVECPLCKHIFLPVDEKRGKAKQSALQTLSHHFAAAAATSYYCVQSGLVRIPKSVRCTRHDLELLEHRIFDKAIAPADLVTLRGNREGGGGSHGGMDVTEIVEVSISRADGVPDEDVEDVEMNHLGPMIEVFSNNHNHNNTNNNNNMEYPNHQALNMTRSTDDTEPEFDIHNLSSFDSGEYVAVGPLHAAAAAESTTPTNTFDMTRANVSVALPVVQVSMISSSPSALLLPMKVRSDHHDHRNDAADNDDDDGIGEELVSASDYLEEQKNAICFDNRCCIDTEDHYGVEVRSTDSQLLNDAAV